MKTFVINLLRSPERKKYISNHLRARALDFEIIEGIDGRNLTEEEIASFCDLKSVKKMPGWLNRGAIGCALSHFEVYTKIIKENLDYAFIIEDDLVLPKNIKEIIRDISREIKESEVILLFYASFTPCGFSTRGMATITNGSLVFPLKAIQPMSAAAYCISRKAAEGMVNTILPIRVAADKWDFFYMQGAFKSFRCYYPMQLDVMHFKSVIDYINPSSTKGRLSNWLDKTRIPGIYHLLKWIRKQTIKKKTSQFFLSDEISPIWKD